MATKKKVGRPQAIDEKTLNKLEYAFALGCSDIEACLFADISHQCLYNFQKRNPEFVERKRALKEKPIFIARKTLVEGLPDDPELCLKFLERKKKDEFSPRTEHEHGGQIVISQDHASKIKKAGGLGE